MTTTILESAIRKAMTMPEAAQEQIGRELHARIESFDTLRAALRHGVDAGLGEEVDVDAVIRQARSGYAEK